MRLSPGPGHCDYFDNFQHLRDLHQALENQTGFSNANFSSSEEFVKVALDPVTGAEATAKQILDSVASNCLSSNITI